MSATVSKFTDGPSPAPASDSEAGAPPIPPASLDYTNDRRGRVASIAEVDRWLAYAETGDVFVYAVRTAWLPITAPGKRRLYALAIQGLVVLSQKPSDLIEGAKAYRAQRSSKPLPPPEPAPTPRAKLSLSAPVIAVDEAAAIDKLLPIVMRAAKYGRPCPTDAQMADRSGLARDAIPATLAAMQAARLVKIEGTSAPTLRLITILATGHRTGFAKA